MIALTIYRVQQVLSAHHAGRHGCDAIHTLLHVEKRQPEGPTAIRGIEETVAEAYKCRDGGRVMLGREDDRPLAAGAFTRKNYLICVSRNGPGATLSVGARQRS